MAKTGRNQPCPCGSGKKFKRCHGGIHATVQTHSLTPQFDEEVRRKIREMEAAHAQRRAQQGLGKPIISAAIAGGRMVAVGNVVNFSKNWRTFHDFLRAYLVDQLGADWVKSEQSKTEVDRHPIVRWLIQSISDIQNMGTKVGEVYSAPMTGAQRAFLNLAYNIYLIAHHADPREAKKLARSFVDRLKSAQSGDFIGKLFETYAAAAFLKAGFTVAYEDESDGRSSHVEFVATYPKTGKKFSVEVKSRNRAANADGSVDDVKRLRVANKLFRALAKATPHMRVVMIEVNVPDVLTDQVFEGWPKQALEQIRHAEKVKLPDGTERPNAYVIVTNHAFHNNLDAVAVGTQLIAAGHRIPDFGPDVPFNRLKDVLESEERHQEILALLDSMRMHYEIPATFDGENPELAFSAGEIPRLKFGQWYQIPQKDGTQVAGRLRDAVVMEEEQSVTGVYEVAGGEHIIATVPLTDSEFAAWKRHPETFFGEVRRQTKGVTNWIELAKFFYESYRNTPREKLLEWMRSANDFEELSKLTQKELAIIYSERTAWAADRQAPSRQSRSAQDGSG